MATLNPAGRSVTQFGLCYFILVVMMASVAFGEEVTESLTYIVHVEKAETGRQNFDETKKWYSSFLTKAKAAVDGSPDNRLMYAYRHVMTGFAARLTKHEVEAMRDLKGFVDAVPDSLVSLHTTYSSEFVGLNPLRGIWPKSDFGRNIIVGVLDTGVWPESASFNDKGMPPVPPRWKGHCQAATDFNISTCNNKIIGAQVFNSGGESAGVNVDRSPRDSAGHGTHTASTAVGRFVPNAEILGYANGTARGMAPSAHLAIYKVCFGESGSCASSDILAGMDQAIDDGVDVLSVSLGGLYQPLYRDVIAIAAFRAIKKGIFVSCSAGNDGPDFASLSNDAPWIMTVGASTMDRSFVANVKLGNGNVLYGETLYPGNVTEMRELPLLDTGEDRMCSDDGALDPLVVRGKLVICQLYISDDSRKRILYGEAVRDAGGAGMILVNSMGIGEDIVADFHLLPATQLGYQAGVSLRAYVSSVKTPTAALVFEGTVFGATSAPSVAKFSSRGPSGSCPATLKPDVIAPGVSVLAAWPSDLSPTSLPEDHRRINFKTVSGTSMSCPHVSGIAALLKSAHPDWSPAAIKSAVMTTADTLDTRRRPIVDSATNDTADVFATGAGHVRAGKAVNPGLIYDIAAEDYVPYLCGLNYTIQQIRMIVSEHVDCPPSSDESTLPGNLNYPSFALVVTELPLSTTFRRTVTNVGLPNSTYTVDIVPPDGVEVTVNPRSLSFTSLMEKKSYNVTFVVTRRPIGAASSSSQSFIRWVSKSATHHYLVRSPISVKVETDT